jgi:hypothetical protein
MLRSMSARWVAITLVCLAAVAVATDVSRLQAPQGERYLNYVAHWPSDFRAGLEATRALLAGLDPYREALPDAVASDRFVVDGVTYRYCYPPPHLLVYVPLALVTRDNDLAARIWLALVLAMLLAMAAIAWRLAGAMTPTPPLAIALAFVLIAIHPGTLLALERVQSDLVIACFCWCAVLLVLRERLGAAVFVALAAALIKPYAALFAVGIVGVAVERRRWRQLAVAAVAALLLVLPVARFWPESVRAVRPRAELFWPSWQNWSLANVSYAIRPGFAEPGRVLLCALCAAVATLAWLRLRRALNAGDAAARALWLTLFAVCALEAMIGWARTAYDYAMVMLLPGMIVLALVQPYLHDRLALTQRARVAAGAWLTLVLGAFWLVRPWWKNTPVPLAGFAIVALVVTIGVVALREKKS